MTSAIASAYLVDGEWQTNLQGQTAHFGVANPTPINEQTGFDLASVTKVLCTTTLIMRAVESKIIKISDPVSRFLSSWADGEKSDLTIEDLLRHESGLEEWRPFYISCANPNEVLDLISKLPLKYPKQKEFYYSDLNFITLGAVLNQIHSAALDVIFKAEIAQPLGLSETQFAKPSNKNNVAATSKGDSIEHKMVATKVPYQVTEQVSDFTNWREQVLSGEVNDGNAFHVFNGVSGHAGLFSNLQDMKRYVDGLLAGFISPPVLAQFSQPRNSQVQGVGFRRFAMKDGGYAVGHFGFTGTGFAVKPETQEGWIYLSNRLHTNESYKTMNEIWCTEFKEFSFLG